MSTLILLPGMDGTGELFSRFLEAFTGAARVIRYPVTGEHTYGELEAPVAAQLPIEEEFVLLGESFSGPIAIKLAANRPRGLKGLILCCSFAKNPRPTLGLFRGIVDFMPSKPPMALLETFLGGRFMTPALRADFARVMELVSPRTLKRRLVEVAKVDTVAALRTLAVPVLYLRATEDRLVPEAAARLIVQVTPKASVVDLVGPHFLLQTAPVEAAGIIQAFMQTSHHAL